MSHHDSKLTRGRALVIVGPQGCGKSQLAEEIAAKYGRFQHIESGPQFDFQLRDALNGRADVVIIDGAPPANRMADIKAIVTNSTMMLRACFGKTTSKVPTPLVVICTHDCYWFPAGSRRFEVIHIQQPSLSLH